MASPRDNLTDEGGRRPSSDDDQASDPETESVESTSSAPAEDVQDSPARQRPTTDGGRSTTIDDIQDSGESSGGSTEEDDEPPEDIQQPGPGAGDSETAPDDGDTGGSSETGSSDERPGSSPPRDDLQDSGPTDGTDTTDTTDTEPGGPPEGVQSSESRPSETASEQDYRAGPGRSATGTQNDTDDEVDTTDDGEGLVSRAEARIVQARDYLDENDVVTVVRDGAEEVRLTASGAAAAFAAEREDVDEEDVSATNNADGGFDIEFTDAAQQDQLEQNYDPGPVGAGEELSGEAGISDEGSPEDPLEGTALERGLGPTADAARDLEERVAEANPGVDESDIEVTAEDGQLEVELARGELTAEQAQAIDEPAPQDPSQLERETTSGVTPDFTTAAVNNVEEQIDQQLQEAGVDPDNVDVNARVEDGEIRVGGEDVNDQEVRFPSADDTDTEIGKAFDAATAPLFAPFGVDGSDVAGTAADEAGIGGQRLESLLAEGSDEYWQTVEENRDAGGEAVQQTVADFASGPFATGGGAGAVGDAVITAADGQTEVDLDRWVDARSGDVFQGVASAGNAPAIALTAKDAAEYTDWAADQNSEVVVEDLTNRAAVGASQASLAFEANPQQFTARLGGALVGGAAVGAVGSAAVPGTLRGTLRGARSATRSTTSRGVNVGQSAVRRAESRTPDVDVTRDPDAPALEIDPELRQQLADRLSPDAPDLSRARPDIDLSSGVNRVRSGVSEGVEQTQDAVENVLGTTRSAATGAVETVRRAPSTAARNVALEARRVRQRASSARARGEFQLSQTRQRLGDARPTFSTGDTDLDIEQAARAAGREFELRRQQAQLELSAFGASAQERVSSLAGGVPSRRDLGDLRFRLGDRAADTVSNARVGGEMLLRTREAPDIDIGLPSPDRPQPLRRLSDTAFRTRERASNRLTSARVGAEMAVRTQDSPDLPSVENPLGGLSDLTVRIGTPESRDTDVDADEFVAEGFDTDEVFDDGETGGAAGGAGIVDGETDAAVGSGGGQQLTAVRRFADEDETVGSVEIDAQGGRNAGSNVPTSVAASAGAMGLTDPFDSVTDAADAGAGVDEFDDRADDALGGLGVAEIGSGQQDTVDGLDSEDVFGTDDEDVGGLDGQGVFPTSGVGTGEDTGTPTDVFVGTATGQALDQASGQTGQGLQGAGTGGAGGSFFDLTEPEDDDDGLGVLGAFETVDDVFDTGTVQSLNELEEASSENGDPWDIEQS